MFAVGVFNVSSVKWQPHKPAIKANASRDMHKTSSGDENGLKITQNHLKFNGASKVTQ
jgi:hypothetical protein